MDCNDNSSLTPSPDFVSPPPESSSALLYNFNYSNYNYNSDQFWPEMKKAAMEGCEEGGNNNNNNITIGGSGVGDQKMMMKKRLTQNQLAALERSFQEEVKVDPDRKMKLSKELGLQPRQVAVWFQNRRARWKAKQLELLYHTLKQQFDTISQEKHFLEQEVMKLRSMLREQAAAAGRNQGSSVAHTDVSGEETTVESTSVGIRSCNNDSYMIYNSNNMEDFNQISAASAPPEAFWWADANHHPSYP